MLGFRQTGAPAFPRLSRGPMLLVMLLSFHDCGSVALFARCLQEKEKARKAAEEKEREKREHEKAAAQKGGKKASTSANKR